MGSEVDKCHDCREEYGHDTCGYCQAPLCSGCYSVHDCPEYALADMNCVHLGANLELPLVHSGGYQRVLLTVSAHEWDQLVARVAELRGGG